VLDAFVHIGTIAGTRLITLETADARHEITTGRTSTVSNHTMGYTGDGAVKVSAHRVRTLTDEELVRGSEKVRSSEERNDEQGITF
jgi:hypothetical protein